MSAKPVCFNYQDYIKIQEELQRTRDELTDCRNELCGMCGRYKMAHLGECDRCRWSR